MSTLPAKSIYRGYDITNEAGVVSIRLNGELVLSGEMTDEQAYDWIDKHRKRPTGKD